MKGRPTMSRRAVLAGTISAGLSGCLGITQNSKTTSVTDSGIVDWSVPGSGPARHNQHKNTISLRSTPEFEEVHSFANPHYSVVTNGSVVAVSGNNEISVFVDGERVRSETGRIRALALQQVDGESEVLYSQSGSSSPSLGRITISGNEVQQAEQISVPKEAHYAIPLGEAVLCGHREENSFSVIDLDSGAMISEGVGHTPSYLNGKIASSGVSDIHHYALSEDGSIESRWNESHGTRSLHRPVLTDTKVLLGSASSVSKGQCLAHALEDGDQPWSPISKGSNVYSPAVSDNIAVSSIYGLEDGKSALVAFDVSSGTIQWKKEFEITRLQTPVIGNENTVVGFGGGENSGILIGLDLATGDELWRHSVPSYVHQLALDREMGLLVSDSEFMRFNEQ